MTNVVENIERDPCLITLKPVDSEIFPIIVNHMLFDVIIHLNHFNNLNDARQAPTPKPIKRKKAEMRN